MPASQGHRARLRARFGEAGFSGFAPHESIELLLTLCIPYKDVKPQAKALLSRFGSLRGVLDAPPEELRKVKGLGAVAPTALKIIREAASLYLRQTAEQRQDLNSFEALETFWRHRLGGLPHEEFHAAYLDSSHRLIQGGVEEMEKGVPSQAAVYPRKVMESALKIGATALVVAHNHPSGDCYPSAQDKELTRALHSAANALQIRFLDHYIVTADAAFSFRREGLL